MSADSTRAAYVRALSFATLALVFLSWPLWNDARPYPRVPFVRDWPAMEALRFALVATLVLATVLAGRRFALVPALCILGLSILGDQDRLQPWAYQFLVVGVALASAPSVWGLRLARWFHAAMYFHSGLSKLDWTFAHELGRSFLSVPARVLGVSLADVPETTLDALALLMPAAEVALALLLVFSRTRAIGLSLAIVLHVGILAVLGPWGLDHGLTVLVWNVALGVEEVILFRVESAPAGRMRWDGLSMPLRILFGAIVLLPFFERLGLWDTWPSFAVYASHNERGEIYLHTDDRDRWPEALRPHVRDVGRAPWMRLDLLGWSRATRGAPPYPQVRTTLGVAHALLVGEGAPRSIRVVVRGRADRWTGRRSEETIHGREALERRLRRFRLNAWPARPPTGSPNPGIARLRKDSDRS
jgi:hypothetical protein